MASLNDMRDDDGKLPEFAFPGGYPIYYVGGGDAFCPECANEQDADPEIEAADVNWECPDLYCDECSRRIESAYAEDEAVEHA